MSVDDKEMAAMNVKRAPLMGPEGAAQGVPDRPAETALEETKFVRLVNIVERNMKKEMDSLDNFGTYVWVPEKMAEQKGVIVDKS
eukprot:4945359-Heterocapsa_arctica.AAC.1